MDHAPNGTISWRPPLDATDTHDVIARIHRIAGTPLQLMLGSRLMRWVLMGAIARRRGCTSFK